MSNIQKIYLFGCLAFILFLVGRYSTSEKVRIKTKKALLKEGKETLFGAVVFCMIIWPIVFPMMIKALLLKKEKEND